MRIRLHTLTVILIALLAVACSNQKNQTKANKKVLPPLKEQIVGAWTTEGSSEQLDDNLMTGYGQRLELNKDNTFKLEALMSVSGAMPYGISSVSVSAMFGVEIKGTYALKDKELTLIYNSDSVVANMDPDDIEIYDTDITNQQTLADIRMQMFERLESFGINSQMLESTLRESVHGKADRFTDISTNGSYLRMKFEGDEIIYYRDDL